MATTIKDVAKVVGVTATTVSMVMRGDTRISAPTREKVLKAAKELNYYPNQAGRGLVKGKTNTIAIVSKMFFGPFKTDILNGIDYELYNGQYKTLNFAAKGDDGDVETLKEILYGRRADAVIAINLNVDKSIAQAYRDEKRPIVFVEDVVEGYAGIGINGFRGAYMATEHLIKTGRKNIGIITGKHMSFAHVKDRIQGYKKALEDNGLVFDESAMVAADNYTFHEGKDLFKKFMELDKKVDAVFSASGDLSAMGFMKAAKENGVKMPEDIAIIGYDGLDSGSLISPALTTVKQPIFEMGQEAYKMILDMLENNSQGEMKIFEPELVIRESA